MERIKTLKEVIAPAEKEYIKKIFNQTYWNYAKTARILGISRALLKKKIKEYDLL